MTAALWTALGGALERHPEGWRWRDGTPARHVTDLLLIACAPNFRCATYGSGSGTVVAIPHDWRARRHWPSGRVDTETARVIDDLIRDCGTRGAIYADGLAEAFDDHRARIHGWTVPVAQWDAVMRAPCGASWDRAHEDAILTRARRHGWSR